MECCCNKMELQLNNDLKVPNKQSNHQLYKNGFIGIPYYDGSILEIKFCPWCGTKIDLVKFDLK